MKYVQWGSKEYILSADHFFMVNIFESLLNASG